MNSNEEYLDSLLKSVEQKEASIQEAGIVDDLSELDNFSMPEDLFAPVVEELSEELYMEENAGIPEELVVPEVEPEIIVQSEETTVLDILKSNPDRLLSPEQIETMFANAEADNNTVDEDDDANEADNFDIGDLFAEATEETWTEETLVEETLAETVDFSSEIENIEESEEPMMEGDSFYSDDIQSMAEDDIMRLLQQSSDISSNSENDSMNLDFLFDDMSGDSNVAQIEDMIEKAENNEPVSSEVEEMIQLGLKADTEEIPMPLPAPIPKVIINKIKDSFVNIFKKDKKEKDKEKKEKKTKVKKSLFSRKNKKTDQEEVQLPTWDSVPESTDIPLWDNSQDAADVPLWDNAQDAADIPLWDNAQDAADVPLWDNAQDVADVPSMDDAQDLDDISMMEKLMANADANVKEEVDTSFFDQLFVDDSQVEATGIGQEEFSGFVEGLFEQEPDVQMNNNDASEISALLSSLENAETEADLNNTNVDLFAGMEQEVEIDLENAGELDFIREKEDETLAKKEKKPGFFKRLFTLLTEEDEEPEEILVTSENADGVDELGATSDVNKEAMAQLDKEGPEDKKKKKKGKKGKKGEEEVKDGEEDDEDEEPVEDKKKKKKPKKEKKQKEPKFYDDSPKLSKKKIRATVLASISIAAAILVCSLFIPELFELRSARNAFYDGDYETSYKSLYGKKLSDSDRIIFEQSEFLLALERRVESYYNYMAIEDELRAVEVLIQEVAKQKDILTEAEKYGLEAEAEYSYQDLLQILYEKYGVSEEEALTISAYRQDALFTLHVRAIAAGEEFVCPDYLREDGQTNTSVDVQEEEFIEETLEDVLPAEEELAETEFEEGTN